VTRALGDGGAHHIAAWCGAHSDDASGFRHAHGRGDGNGGVTADGAGDVLHGSLIRLGCRCRQHGGQQQLRPRLCVWLRQH